MKVESHILINAKPEVVQKRHLDVARALNGGLEFGSIKDGPVNISGTWVQIITPDTPDTEFTVTHNLGRVPSILLSTPDIPAIIYASRRVQWTVTQAFFKSDQASVPLTAFIF